MKVVKLSARFPILPTSRFDGRPFYPADKSNHIEQCPSCGNRTRYQYRVEDPNGDYVKGARVRITAEKVSE